MPRLLRQHLIWVCASLIFAAVAYAVGTEDGFSTATLPSGINNYRKCESVCDCYKNSGTFDTDSMHLCMECSQVNNNTCRTVAGCPAGQMCTINPRAGSDELVCLQPEKVAESCIIDADCTFSYYQEKDQVVSDEDDAMATVTRRKQMRTFSGYCLPNGKCRYLPYGIFSDSSAVIHSLTPLDHNTCRPKAEATCRTTEDCLYLGKGRDTIQNHLIMCDSEDSICSTVATMMGKSAKLTQRQQLLARSGANTTTTTPVRSVTIPPTVGIQCRTEQDCYDHSSRNDMTSKTSCYACVKAAVADNSTTPNYNVSNVCVKTSSTCTSGMCLNGQCIGKMCRTHTDCIEIGGITRHSHQCDQESGMCAARFICPYGTYCTLDFGKDHRCSVLVNPCRLDASEAQVLEDIRNNLRCIPMGKTGAGYYRLTDAVRGAAESRNKGTAGAAKSANAKAAGDALSLLRSHAKASTRLSLENNVVLEVAELRQSALEAERSGDGKEEGKKDSEDLLTLDILPERPTRAKITQRTPTQANRKRRSESVPTVGSNGGGESVPVPTTEETQQGTQQPKITTSEPTDASGMTATQTFAYVALIVLSIALIPLLIHVALNASSWVKMKFYDKHGNPTIQYVKEDTADVGPTNRPASDGKSTKRKKITLR
jgi:hypothetical protein